MKRSTHPLLAPGLAGALCALLLAGCGSDSESAAAGTSSATDDPGVVVALDDFAAVHALTLGVTPDVVLNAFQYESTTAILEDIGGIEIKPYGPELDPEVVLAAEPDIVIGVSLPTTLEVQKDLEEFSDVTVFDYAASWDEQLTDVGQALGRETEAAALISGIDKDIDQLENDVANTDFAGSVASIVANNQGLFSVPETTGLGSLLKAVGLQRPPDQRQADGTPGSPFVEFSSENLRDHDGEVLFVLTGGAYDPKPLYRNPLWKRLEAVRADRVPEVSGELWLGSSAFSVDWVLDDLRRVLVEGTAPASNADAAEAFEQFRRG